jgi:Uma2 family endonuclease
VPVRGRCRGGKLAAGCLRKGGWVVEVLSAATAGHDQVRKLALYERRGISEYWLVHTVDRVVTIYRLENGVYGRPIVHELQGRSSCSACPGVAINRDTIVRGLPDEPERD